MFSNRLQQNIFAGSLEKGNIFFFKNVLKIITSEKGILVNG